jgi:hypothetical protein
MTKRENDLGKEGRWVCPHGFETGFFPVLERPHLIAYRSCGICCEEISEKITRADAEITGEK